MPVRMTMSGAFDKGGGVHTPTSRVRYDPDACHFDSKGEWAIRQHVLVRDPPAAALGCRAAGRRANVQACERAGVRTCWRAAAMPRHMQMCGVHGAPTLLACVRGKTCKRKHKLKTWAAMLEEKRLCGRCWACCPHQVRRVWTCGRLHTHAAMLCVCVCSFDVAIRPAPCHCGCMDGWCGMQ
eukprot:50722-Chlamydomonas_euryale.AAC.2